MAERPQFDYAGVLHLHSTYSDGTGTVPEIAAAGRQNALDFVLLTDHDTLEAKERGEEGWYGGTLLLVGIEISPRRRDHFLAFGLDEPVRGRGKLSSREICDRVADAGGFGFIAHPYSKGPTLFGRTYEGNPWTDLDCGGFTGIELWSFVTDYVSHLGGVAAALRFILDPAGAWETPPEQNLQLWDRLCRDRPVVAVGGLDAHQIGWRVAGHVPIKLMSYRRSFRHLRTHVLSDRGMTGELETDRETVYEGLCSGRCYIAMDSLAAPRGFGFSASRDGETVQMGETHPPGSWTLRVESPVAADLRLLRDGEPLAEAGSATALEREVSEPGAYRVEARLRRRGRDRTWVLTNPIYLR